MPYLSIFLIIEAKKLSFVICFFFFFTLFIDVQELSLTVSSLRSENEVIFEESRERQCALDKAQFIKQQEWNVYNKVKTSKKSINDVWNHYKRAGFSTSIFISRKPGYFLYNAYMLIFFVTALGLCTFSFSISNNNTRVQVASLLILTSINFRWIITKNMPTISYLTTLDSYSICALVFLVILCAWNGIIGSSLIEIINIDRLLLDMIVLIILGALFAIFQVIYAMIFIRKYRTSKHVDMDIIAMEPKNSVFKKPHLK